MRSTPRFLLSAAAAAVLAAPLAAGADPLYTVVPLAGAGSYATDINNLGQAVGYTSGSSGYSAFLSAGGTFTDIGAALGVSSAAASINDAGQVVGNSESGAFLYSGGSASLIPGVTTAQGINNGGTIVGAYSVPTPDGSISHAYSKSGGTLTDLGTLSYGDASWAYAVNNKGDVAGEATNVFGGAPNFPTDPFLYHAGTMTGLGNFGGVWSAALSINDARQVVGYSGLAYDPADVDIYPTAAFLYDATGLHNLGSLAPHFSSVASDINNLGQIVGAAGVASGADHGFLYVGGTMVDLNTLIDPASGWTIAGASAINDKQQIVGQACKGGICEAVRLDLVSAVPEPPEYAVMLAGLVLLRRRRTG